MFAKDSATTTEYAKSPYAADAGKLTRRQVGIWFPIMFFLIILSAVYALFAIDDPKHRDTILYAKFIANLKEKQA